jgi:DNA-binding LacI/PurR family transcriptional regulator
MEQPARVTIAAVAEAVGLSSAAVSQILNDKGSFPEETRQRVREVAENLGYRPHRLASALRTGRTMTVGLVISGSDDPLWTSYWGPVTSEILRDSAEALNAGDYALMVIPQGKIEWISPDTLDALILSDTAWEDPDLEAAIAAGLPVVTNDRLFDQRITLHVDSGYGSMTTAAMDLFLSRGSKRPALFAEPNQLASDASAETAYLDWCQRHGIEPLVERSDYTRSNLETQIARLLERGADAIFSFVGEGIRVKDTLEFHAKPAPSQTLLITAELSSGEETVAAGITTMVYHANKGPKVAVPVLIDILHGVIDGPAIIETGWELSEASSTTQTSRTRR